MKTIEVVGVDMMCFKVDAESLNPIGPSYYQPAAWNDPAGNQQMDVNEWNLRRDEMRMAAIKQESKGGKE